MRELDAVYASLAAFAIAGVLTPLVARVAVRVGAVDQPRDRGLADRPTPLLGGLAMLAATLVAGLIWLPANDRWHGVLAGAALIAVIGAIDDRFDLHPAIKLVGQVGAALIPALSGVEIANVTLPAIGAFSLGGATVPLTVVALVAVMNVVNFSDGVDGLAAGVCAIIAIAFAIIAFDLEHVGAGILAAIVAGAGLGFLIHNFPPASIFMGDTGANLLGLLMGCVAVEGALKTSAVVTLVVPLVLLAVPFLDTTFVVLKRLKYKRAPYRPDAEHFHHRLARIGYSRRRTVAFFYGWTVLLAGLALAMRFIPYSDGHGHLRAGWSLLLLGCGLLVALVSVYLVYELEILKFRRSDAQRLRILRPDASDEQIAGQVEEDLETGEFQPVKVNDETGDFEALRR